MGSLTTKLEFFKEELNTGVGWGRCHIKVGVGVGNSFPTPDKGCSQYHKISNFLRGVERRRRLGSGSLISNLEFLEEELNTGVGWGQGQKF